MKCRKYCFHLPCVYRLKPSAPAPDSVGRYCFCRFSADVLLKICKDTLNIAPEYYFLNKHHSYVKRKQYLLLHKIKRGRKKKCAINQKQKKK